jgi:hypothetical protein
VTEKNSYLVANEFTHILNTFSQLFDFVSEFLLDLVRFSELECDFGSLILQIVRISKVKFPLIRV